ncbi:hypothetical protein AWM75_03110 [Aerococcus urinaehominis]|uniref:Uncharacterized protein n=1 Tax=Aerococcus urinaehominis TaxID=128944 RepID=A0A0X8FKM6_9LACT|nr:AraC family transcriptional regulator [Aerococcus urinaehominis]AMB99050.1 hypothetical protein AWM75_03110 [Aerococcus urinaehominis]SDM50424.1 AraC-type DNA-binding protein [Aerococcus urinaehominis]
MDVVNIYNDEKIPTLSFHDEHKTRTSNYYNEIELTPAQNAYFQDGINRMHQHNYVETFIYLGNQCHFTIDQDDYLLYKGDILIIPAYTPHQINHEKGINNSRYVLHIPLNLLKQYEDLQRKHQYNFQEYFNRPGHYRLDQEGSEEIYHYLNQVLDLPHEDLAESYFEACYYIYKALSKIFRSQKLPQLSGSYQEDRHFSHIIYYIENNYRNPSLQLESITEEFDISPYYFSKLFKTEMKRNFHEYIIDKRVNYARALMLDIPSNRMTLQEIAQAAGFGDYSTFYRAFKKHYDKSPNQFLKSLSFK